MCLRASTHIGGDIPGVSMKLKSLMGITRLFYRGYRLAIVQRESKVRWNDLSMNFIPVGLTPFLSGLCYHAVEEYHTYQFFRVMMFSSITSKLVISCLSNMFENHEKDVQTNISKLIIHFYIIFVVGVLTSANR